MVPPPAFADVLSEQGVAWAPHESALVDGGDYLEEVHPVPVADECSDRAVWIRYFEIRLDHVGAATDVSGLAEAMTARWECTECVEPYPSTVPVAKPRPMLVDLWLIEDAETRDFLEFIRTPRTPA